MINNYYKLRIEGKDLKRFINTLIHLKIYFNYNEITEKECFIIVDEDNYKKVKELKSSYNIKVIKTYGPVKYKSLLKKYFWFLTSIFLCFLLLTFLSSLIFRVEIVHSNKEIRDLVRRKLEYYDIKPYRFKVPFKKREEILKKILEDEKEKLEWLEIKSSGTTYIVNVEERKKNQKKESTEEQDIIAKKDAMILKIEAISGEIQKKKYDYVKRGDVIISGFIKNKEDVVSKVKADGRVFGEVWYKVSVEIPKIYIEKKYTNNKKTVLQIKYLDKEYNLFSKFKEYDSENKFIISNNILPISIGFKNLKETVTTRKIYNKKNISSKAISIASDKLLKKIGKYDTIISKKVLKKTEKNSKILVDVFFKVSEDITDSVSIKDKEIPNSEKEKEE